VTTCNPSAGLHRIPADFNPFQPGLSQSGRQLLHGIKKWAFSLGTVADCRD
jgi:hypothetical protein